MHKFEYRNDLDDTVELEVLKYELEAAAQWIFERMVADEGLESAIESVAGVFWKEAEANVAVGNIDYILDMLIDDERVLNLAENNAIRQHEGS